MVEDVKIYRRLYELEVGLKRLRSYMHARFKGFRKAWVIDSKAIKKKISGIEDSAQITQDIRDMEAVIDHFSNDITKIKDYMHKMNILPEGVTPAMDLRERRYGTGEAVDIIRTVARSIKEEEDEDS